MSSALKHHLRFGDCYEVKHYVFQDKTEYIEIIEAGNSIIVDKDEWEHLVKIGNGFFSKES